MIVDGYGLVLVLGEHNFFIRDQDQVNPSIVLKEFKKYAEKRWPHLTILWSKRTGEEITALRSQDFADFADFAD